MESTALKNAAVCAYRPSSRKTVLRTSVLLPERFGAGLHERSSPCTFGTRSKRDSPEFLRQRFLERFRRLHRKNIQLTAIMIHMPRNVKCFFEIKTPAGEPQAFLLWVLWKYRV